LEKLNSSNSSTENSKKQKTNKYIIGTIVLVLLLGSFFSFGIAWYDRANNFSLKRTIEMQDQNNTRFWSEKDELTIENYFPFYSRFFKPLIIKEIYTITGKEFKVIDNTETELKKENITINSYEIGIAFGEEEIDIPFKEISPKEFPRIGTSKMAVTKIIIDWNYNNTDQIKLRFVAVKDIDELYHKETTYEEPMITRGEYLTSYFTPSVLREVLPYLFFVLAGIVFSLIYLNKIGDIQDSFNYLTCNFNLEKETPSENLRNKLEDLQYFPKQIGTLKRIIFGLSILLFEVSINNLIKKLKDECEYSDQTALANTFSNYIEESPVKVSDIIPGRQLIALGLGFLTSVGIGFSWNVGAVVPFLFVCALFYYFLNLGSALFLMGKSKAHRNFILILIGIGIFVILFPSLIAIFRMF